MKMNRILTGVLGFVVSAVSAVAVAAPATQPTTQPYPLKTCVVSGDDLGSMGEVTVLTHEGREVRLCCEGCVPDFKADPAKYIKKLDESVAGSPSTKPSGDHGHGGDHKH